MIYPNRVSQSGLLRVCIGYVNDLIILTKC